MGRHGRSADLLTAGLMFVLYLSLNVATLHRYGITADEPEHWFFGDRYLQFFLTLDPKALDFSLAGWPATQTWPVGSTLAALTAKIFSERLHLVTPHDGHHLACVLLFGLLLGSMYLFLAVHAGRTTALLSCLALALQPRIWGEAHNNSEDVPLLVFYSLTIFAFLHGMITRKAGWLLASGISWGLALGSKINAVSFPLVVTPMLAPWLWERDRKSAAVKASLTTLPMLALSVMFLVWPYFWESPVERLTRFWSYLTHWGMGGPKTWQAAPLVSVLITTPLPILLFAFIGIVATARTGRPLGRRVNLTLLLWLAAPIVRSSLPGVLNYDVIRRFMEFSPSLAIFAGIGGAWLIDRGARNGSVHLLRRAWVAGSAVLLVLLSPVIALWRYFPYESSYYNLLVGGLGGAQSLTLHQSADYWLSSYREGITWINTHADHDSSLIVRHAPHFLPSYPLRKDLVMTTHLWMDDLPVRGRAVYLMYVPTEPYDYNMCLAEAFLRPEYEIRRDGGIILRIYKLTAESNLAVKRDAFAPPKRFSATRERRWVTLWWEPPPVGDVVGHIIYYGRAPGHYEGSACVREKTNRWKVHVGLETGTYYLSMSVLTRQAMESERTPDIRKELLD
jgi:hypothetical protein